MATQTDVETGLAESQPALAPAEHRSGIGLWDAVSIIVGIVIGAGIYETAPLVFGNVPHPLAALGVWALGGLLSLIGACCYAELATAYPRSGGDYVYLTRAFGPPVGFLFGWSQLAVILTGSIGMMAYVFADYAAATWDLDASHTALLAAAAVVTLTALNLSALSVGKAAQNVLTGLKLLGLLAIVLAGVFWGEPSRALVDQNPADTGSFGFAMILVLYTYGGWNDAAFVAAEVRDNRRNLPRALLFGTAIITLVYMLVNAAFLAGLGFEGARSSRAIAADVLSRPLGGWGATSMALLVMISALGAVNALIFTGSRVHASLGADYSALSALGRWHSRWRSPVGSLLAQAVVTLLLIVLVGTTAGRSIVDSLLTSAGLSKASWSGHGGFDTLLRCTAPVFWTFFLLTSVALFVLRAREPERPRPFRVPLYPVLPLLFTATCLYMLYSAVEYAGRLTLLGILLAATGIPLWFASKRRPPRISERAAASAAE